MPDDATIVVAGHGLFGPDHPQANIRSVAGCLMVLRTVRERVAAAMEDGDGLGAVLAAHVSADLDPQSGGGMVSPGTLISSVYDSLAT